MALVPYEPFRHFETMRREFDRLFPYPLGFGYDREMGVPKMDLYETENEVVASCEIPGLEKKEDVNIDVENNVLHISGTVERTHEAKDDQMHRSERFVGRFARSVTLPARVSTEGIKATYRNGVLEVRMPKEQSPTKRKIDLEFH
ncbi:Hsp20/alpha crystallin family protein [Brevibacillus sp. B_LB10_24]|uniref:Hsp20/alpha crystallin family protein n=1 Tax=Brevibacillus sp. B_LB10_24 TaxID=3380645 RepID=UPI0038B88E51